ncbi:MAG: glycine zipper 2TM domain-containing protein [Burkholderiales bacterium]|nr:glycine zipper 2TM domain-containing protein [Burkholderiales bacterium]
MEQVIRTAPRLHPLIATAAASVIVVSAAGVGVMTGVIPATHATAPTVGAVLPAPVASPSVIAAAAPVAAPVAAASPAPAARPAPRAQVVAMARNPEEPRTLRTTPSSVQPAVMRETTDSGYGGERRVARAAVDREVYERMPAERETYGRPVAERDPYGRPVAERSPYERNPYERNPYERNPYGDVAQGPQSAPYGSVPASGTFGNTGAGPAVAQTRPVCGNCGVVEAVVETTRPGEGSGLGMAGGALGGAVVGKQFGKGRGSDFMTILGAVGGAYAGHQVEKSVRSSKTWEVRVRMDDGSVRSIPQTTQPGWRSGERVRVDGGSIALAT